MQQRKIPVACVQTRAHDRDDFERAWPQIVRLTEAAAQRARLVVLPEATVPGYVLGSEPVIEEQLARAAADIGELARRHGATIVYGSAKIVAGVTHNAAIAVGPDGAELGYAAKQFLWHFDRRWFAAGATLDPIETPLGTLGLLVCADGRIPSIAATLCERGADLLVMPTAWVTSGRDPQILENVQADLMVNVRARENAVPFVAANKAGVERESVAYCGKSAIVGADGTFVARGGQHDEEIVFGEVAIGGGAHAASRATFAGGHTARAARTRARIAFTLADSPADVARFARFAADADADVLFARAVAGGDAATPLALAHESQAGGAVEAGGVSAVCVRDDVFRSPRGLVEARLAGCDLFVWHASGDLEWQLPFARTRAAELRAYVLVFAPQSARAFAVDPDGVVLAGTFDRFRLASFVYDPARAAATTVAPTTDVFAGLQNAEAIRAQTVRGTVHA